MLGALHSTSPNHVANTTDLVRHLPDLLVDVSWWVRDLNSLYCCTSRVSLSLFCNMGSSPFAFLFGVGSCSESSAGGCALCRQRWCMPASIVEQMWSDSVGLRMLCWFRALSLMLLLRPTVDMFGSCDYHSLLLHCEIALLDYSMLWGDVDGFVPSTGLQKYHDFKVIYRFRRFFRVHFLQKLCFLHFQGFLQRFWLTYAIFEGFAGISKLWRALAVSSLLHRHFPLHLAWRLHLLVGK